MTPFLIFSKSDVKKEFPNFDAKNLVNWQKKGYIQKIRSNFYRFLEVNVDERFLYKTANKIYNPSYISLETALWHYNVIPESVFTITSVTTLKTNQFHTPFAVFNYRHLKPNLYFGYQLVDYQNTKYRFADLEKTVLDYLYLNPSISTCTSFEHLRWNQEVLRKINLELLNQYLTLFNSKSLNQRVDYFLKFIYA